jgi:hypothetical protein
MGAIAKIPVRMTVAEFLAWGAEDGRLWQLGTDSRKSGKTQKVRRVVMGAQRDMLAVLTRTEKKPFMNYLGLGKATCASSWSTNYGPYAILLHVHLGS